MIINSIQLRAAGFNLDKVIPPQLEAAAARSGMRTRGSGLRQLRGMGSESGQKGNFPEFMVRFDDSPSSQKVPLTSYTGTGVSYMHDIHHKNLHHIPTHDRDDDAL